MNEDHVIAAILTAGLVAQNKSIELKPKDAVALSTAGAWPSY